MKGSMFWKGGEIRGARASLEVRSKAMGGDLARFGASAGGVSTWGGEVAEGKLARDMVVPGGCEDHPAYARLASEASDARAGVSSNGGRAAGRSEGSGERQSKSVKRRSRRR